MLKQSSEINQMKRDNEFLAKTIKQIKQEQEKIKNFSGEIDLKNVCSKAFGDEKIDFVFEK